MAVKYFRRMIEGQDLIIYIDHKPHCIALHRALIANSKNDTPRVTRHLEYIGHFTINIQYVAGEANPVAEALPPVEAISFPTPIDYEALAKSQEQDRIEEFAS